MRGALPGLLLLLSGCPPPAPPAPSTPAAPVLVDAPGVLRRRLFLLRGAAADDVVVRLYSDSACAGPVNLQTSAASLREGLTVELVAGSDNFFSADAVSSRGVSSRCSAPLRVRYVPALPPGRPSVDSRPPSPSSELQFRVVGAADLGTRVQLHDRSCNERVLAELSATEFFEVGFPVDVPPHGVRMVAVAAVNEDTASECVLLFLSNDSTPPFITVRLGSPTPAPLTHGWLVFTGDAERYRVQAGSDCTGDDLASCTSCTVLPVEFPADASTRFSVLGMDSAGNSRCVPADEPWVHDPSLPEEQAVVLLPGVFIPGFVPEPRIEVPFARLVVQIFLSDDCSGQVMQERRPFELIVNGLELPARPDGGFVTARSIRLDGGWDPCSNALFYSP